MVHVLHAINTTLKCTNALAAGAQLLLQGQLKQALLRD
jgi:hypothetical protein